MILAQLFSSSTKAATRWTYIADLKVQTCEAALRLPGKSAWDLNTFSKIRSLLSKHLQSRRPDIYDPVIRYVGSLSDLKPEKAEAISSRLLSILSAVRAPEGHLVGHAIEIRGDLEIRETASQLRANLKAVERELSRVGGKVESWPRYILNRLYWPWLYVGITGLIGYFDYESFKYLLSGSGMMQEAGFYGNLLMAFLFTVTLKEMIPKFFDSGDMQNLNFRKFDINTRRLLNYLRQPVGPNQLIVQSWNGSAHPQTAYELKNLMETDEPISIGAREWMVRYHTPRPYPEAGRHILLDHFIYYDDETQEPVWLIVYRVSSRPPDVR